MRNQPEVELPSAALADTLLAAWSSGDAEYLLDAVCRARRQLQRPFQGSWLEYERRELLLSVVQSLAERLGKAGEEENLPHLQVCFSLLHHVSAAAASRHAAL
jgi:hypothetical protein